MRHRHLQRALSLLTGSLALGPLVAAGCDGTASNQFPCADSTPDDVGPGFESCSNGLLHRSEVATCEVKPRDFMCNSEVPTPDCEVDDDCTARPHGYCTDDWSGCSCAYGCLSDDDCDDGWVCLCGTPVGRCALAGCTTDDDCDGDLVCGATRVNADTCSPVMAFACQAAEDECAVAEDCGEGETCILEDGTRRCVDEQQCTIGRPFLVEGRQRLAEARARFDWLGTPARASLGRLSSSLRERLAERWTAIGLMEHASIAAFARFSLQLLELGAPAELIEKTNQALVDETSHARACFALASLYAGQPVGPGKLSTRDALAPSTLSELVILVMREGCIGETVASVEAAEMAQCARDPEVASLLARIADDELRHAELAWSFVRWALETGDEMVRLAVREVLLHEPSGSDHASLHAGEGDDLSAHGLMGDCARRKLRRDVLASVVHPCATRLLQATSPNARTQAGASGVACADASTTV